MIAPGGAARIVHPLLDHRPAAVVGDDEAVQIEREAVLDGGAVDLGDEPARFRKRRAVEAGTIAGRDQLVRGPARMTAPPAADAESELARHRVEAALERADHAGGDSRRMPVHPHHRAERLEPKGMGETAQKLVAAVMVDDRLGHHRAEPGHSLPEPGRNPAAVERQIGASGPLRHRRLLEQRRNDDNAAALGPSGYRRASASRSRRPRCGGSLASWPSSMICRLSSARFSWIEAITGPIARPRSTKAASDS